MVGHGLGLVGTSAVRLTAIQFEARVVEVVLGWTVEWGLQMLCSCFVVDGYCFQPLWRTMVVGVCTELWVFWLHWWVWVSFCVKLQLASSCWLCVEGIKGWIGWDESAYTAAGFKPTVLKHALRRIHACVQMVCGSVFLSSLLLFQQGFVGFPVVGL